MFGRPAENMVVMRSHIAVLLFSLLPTASLFAQGQALDDYAAIIKAVERSAGLPTDFKP